MRRASPIVVVLGAVLLVAGCTGGSPDASATTTPAATASDTSSGSAAPSDEPKSAEEIEAEAFALDDDPAVLAESSGSVPTLSGDQVPAHVRVRSVAAGDESTQLEFELATESGDEVTMHASALNARHPLTTDIRDVALEEPANNLRHLPFLGVVEGVSAGDASFCVCSDSPKTLDPDGVILYATFSALTSDATTVTVDIPGFEPMTDVPVTRD